MTGLLQKIADIIFTDDNNQGLTHRVDVSATFTEIPTGRYLKIKGKTFNFVVCRFSV